MQCVQINRAVDIKKTNIFQGVKQVIEKGDATSKEISPEPLYTLVMCALPVIALPLPGPLSGCSIM